jgi:hypothetical protein
MIFEAGLLTAVTVPQQTRKRYTTLSSLSENWGSLQGKDSDYGSDDSGDL